MQNLKLILCVLLCVFMGPSLYAQILQGQVLDDSHGKPIPFVRVSQTYGIITHEVRTDTNGRFRLPLHSTQGELTLHHLAYQNKKVFYNYTERPEMLFIMSPREVEIPTVTIEEERIDTVFPDPEIYIYDFEFWEDKLLLILHDWDRRRSKVVLFDEEEHEIVQELTVQEAPGHFFKDCFGNVHVISKHFASQVFVFEDQLELSPAPLDVFNEKLRQCLAWNDSLLFFESYQHNQHKDFYYYDAKNKTKSKLKAVIDWEKYYQRREAGLISQGQSSATDYLRHSVSDSPGRMVEIYFLEKVMLKPLVAFLEKVGEEIYIFNFNDRVLHRFESPTLTEYKIPIHFPVKRGWEEKVLVDEVEEKVYLAHQKNGVRKLYRLEIQTGEMEYSWEILPQFITKIKVHNGKAYFMHKEANYDDVNRLFKLSLG